jgi:hypothetical protein
VIQLLPSPKRLHYVTIPAAVRSGQASSESRLVIQVAASEGPSRKTGWHYGHPDPIRNCEGTQTGNSDGECALAEGEVCRYDASLESFFLHTMMLCICGWAVILVQPRESHSLVRSVVGRSGKWRLAVPAPRPPLQISTLTRSTVPRSWRLVQPEAFFRKSTVAKTHRNLSL